MGKEKMIRQSQGQRCNIERIVQVKVKAETDGRNVVESRAQTESQDKEWLSGGRGELRLTHCVDALRIWRRRSARGSQKTGTARKRKGPARCTHIALRVKRKWGQMHAGEEAEIEISA